MMLPSDYSAETTAAFGRIRAIGTIAPNTTWMKATASAMVAIVLIRRNAAVVSAE